MFTQPIKHTPLNSLQEVMSFSYRTENRAKPRTRWQNNSQVAFTDEFGNVLVTPYRPEVHRILAEAGYREEAMYVPFSNSEERPDAYQWLAKIAEEEAWALTHEEAFKVASKKGIKPVLANGKYWIKEFSDYDYDDTDTHTIYTALTMKFLHNQSRENIGTYIIVDDKTLVICDELGRSFLLKAKTVVNHLVNELIDAGYTRTLHPEWYIRHYVPKEEATVEPED